MPQLPAEDTSRASQWSGVPHPLALSTYFPRCTSAVRAYLLCLAEAGKLTHP